MNIIKLLLVSSIFFIFNENVLALNVRQKQKTYQENTEILNENFGLSGPSKAFNFSNKLSQEFTKPLFHKIKIGKLDIVLEHTTLYEIKDAFGGEIKHQGDAGNSVYWLCYKDRNTQNIVWFISDGEMGGNEHSLTGFAIEPMLGSDCNAQYELSERIQLDIPNIGNNLNNIKNKFKTLKINNNKNFIFYSQFPYITKPEFVTQQSISYTLENDIITKLWLTQITSN